MILFLKKEKKTHKSEKIIKEFQDEYLLYPKKK